MRKIVLSTLLLSQAGLAQANESLKLPVSSESIEAASEQNEFSLYSKYFSVTAALDVAEEKLADIEAGGFEYDGHMIKIPYIASAMGVAGSSMMYYQGKAIVRDWAFSESPIKRDLREFFRNKDARAQIQFEMDLISKEGNARGKFTQKQLRDLSTLKKKLVPHLKDIARLRSNILIQTTIAVPIEGVIGGLVRRWPLFVGGALVYASYEHISSQEIVINANVVGDIRNLVSSLRKQEADLKKQINELESQEN